MNITKIVQNIFKMDSGSANMVKDPICGMKVNLVETLYKSIYQGKVYGFCSPGCKATFDGNPVEYTDPNC